jgi:cysteine-rich repeat protein
VKGRVAASAYQRSSFAMNLRLCPHLLPWLLLACTNHPDSALFSSDEPTPTETNDAGTKGVVAGGGSTSETPPAAAGTAAAGGTTAAGGVASGGAAPVGGTASEAGTAGDDANDAAAGAGAAPGTTPDPPVCGNGKLEAGEECDDAKHEGKDGCSAACKVVCSDFGEGVEASTDHHCYAGYDEATFERAQAACEKLGGHLVTIGSAAENDLVSGFVSSSKFIGAFEDVELMSEAAAEYEWITGEVFSYENWDSQQPDRAGERCTAYANNARCFEHCASMQGDGTWADQRCDVADGYVCEWEPAGAR